MAISAGMKMPKLTAGQSENQRDLQTERWSGVLPTTTVPSQR
jgi:hypothetical protein